MLYNPKIMTNPENRNLILLMDDQNQPREIRINPLKFSERALRQIVRFQIFRDDMSIEIAMINGKTALLPAGTIRKARDLFGNDRKRFLDATASAMCDAKEVIIRRTT
jgi:hypothetical protein